MSAMTRFVTTVQEKISCASLRLFFCGRVGAKHIMAPFNTSDAGLQLLKNNSSSVSRHVERV